MQRVPLHIVNKIKSVLIHNGFNSVSSHLHANDADFITYLFMNRDEGDWRSSIYLARADEAWVLGAYFELAIGGKKKLEDYYQTESTVNLTNKLLTYLMKLNKLSARFNKKVNDIPEKVVASIQISYVDALRTCLANRG